MKLTTTAMTAICSLLFVGCNQLNRVGSQAVVFDTDPFAQLDQDQSAQSAQNQPGQSQHAQNPQYASGRVSVGNLSGGAVPPNSTGQVQQTQPSAAAQTRYTYNPGTMAPAQPANTQNTGSTAPTPATAHSSPASRAAAEAAAMLAQRRQRAQQQQPVQQIYYETPEPMVAAADSMTPADFADGDPFGESGFESGNGIVPMPPEAQFNPDSQQFELTDADLALPANGPTRNPHVFPGTNIPMPAGRTTLESIPTSEWEPSPVPVAEPIATNPVFSPPASNTAAPVSSPQPTPATQVVPVIQDSTNHSKWRAARRG